MPLYTHIVCYKGANYVAQSRRSNPKGFPDWTEALPAEVRKKIDPYQGNFEAVPDRQNVWKNSFNVDGNDLVVFVVQTDS